MNKLDWQGFNIFKIKQIRILNQNNKRTYIIITKKKLIHMDLHAQSNKLSNEYILKFSKIAHASVIPFR